MTGSRRHDRHHANQAHRLSKALWSDQAAEFLLTAIVSTSSERELLSSELTVRVHNAQTLTCTSVDDLPDFTSALRDAVRNATTPVPAPQSIPREGVAAQIAELADLHAAGILTADEFQSKKTELPHRR